MIQELVHDEELLSKPCEKATEEDAQVAEDLLETFESLEEVACLAANQIGVTKQIVVYVDENGKPQLMLNPILKRALYPIKAEEECMTLDYPVKVTRYGKINVEYDILQDGKLYHRQRDFSGNTAQAIQHVIDHCKGKLV